MIVDGERKAIDYFFKPRSFLQSDPVPSRVDYYYYVIAEYDVDNKKFALREEITHHEFLKLGEGSIIKVRILPEDPAIAQLG